ncbi:MAG: YgjV family protein [Firmicutes bacterium]|nr:YgjV family protein [Bacillota bacterium]
MTIIIANAFGVLSTLCFIISFQVKSNRGLFVIQSIANVFYGVQFYLLGATGGLFNMGLQILRNMLLCKYNDWPWVRNWFVAILFCVPSLINMILTWESWLDLLPFIAMVVGTLTYWTNSAKNLRLGELFCVSPCWLLYDLMTKAYGGLLTELVILGSVIASIIRFGWKGLDDPSFKK